MIKHLLIGLIVSVCLASLAVAIPTEINFQGVLKDGNSALVNDTVLLTFNLYSDSTTTTPLWTEVHAAVTVEAGLYSVQLGSMPTSPLSTSLFDGSTKYLGVTVGTSGTELSPRIPLVSVPYAISAGSVKGKISLVRLGTLSTQTTTATYGAWVQASDVGVFGSGETIGVYGYSDSPSNIAAVYGSSVSGTAILGYSVNSRGAYGQSSTGIGVYGKSNTGYSAFFDGGTGIYVDGPITHKVVSVAGDYTATDSDNIILVDAALAGGPGFFVTLPPASSATIGRMYKIYKTDSVATVVAIRASGSDTLQGTVPARTTTQWQSINVIGSSATEWFYSIY